MATPRKTATAIVSRFTSVEPIARASAGRQTRAAKGSEPDVGRFSLPCKNASNVRRLLGHVADVETVLDMPQMMLHLLGRA